MLDYINKEFYKTKNIDIHVLSLGTGQAIEIIGMVMGVYLFLSLFTSLVMNLFNRFMKVDGER